MRVVEQSAKVCSRCHRREPAKDQRYCSTCKNEKQRERRLFIKEPYTKKALARRLACLAVARGKIEPKECEVCGEPVGVTKHHPNYAKPLLVVFACKDCHRRLDELRRDIEKPRELSKACG